MASTSPARTTKRGGTLQLSHAQARKRRNDSYGIAGLYLTPRDLAKYGYLYLNKGNWNGSQVVSEQWVEESTRF